MEVPYPMSSRFIFAVFCALALVSCGSTTLTTTGPKQASRGEHCNFEVFTAAPSAGFTEIGTVDVQGGSMGINLFTDLTACKAKIEPYVCSAGGDAALAAAEGHGWYIKATVLKRDSNATLATPATPAAAAAKPTGGCQFDTQCKGNRICQKGECVDQPAKP